MKKYDYFVSFSYETESEHGISNSRVSRIKPITTFEDISEIEKLLMTKSQCDNIVIINYILLQEKNN